MNIVSQNYNNIIKNLIESVILTNLKSKLKKLDINNTVFNYINLLSSLDDNLNEIARKSLVDIIESIDNSFSISNERKRKYEIKSHHTRTILTIFGEISFKRTFYKSKLNGKNYCYVDRFFGLHKYDYFDPYIKSLIIEYSSNNSYPKTAKYVNDLIGNRISINDKFKFISRQSIRNIILSSKFSKQLPNYKENTPESLYIIADEKWISTQRNDNKKVMEKSVVIFEGIKNHKIINKQIFASINNSFLDNSIDYIYQVYNLSKIKNIFIMGDGAKWIKNLKYEYKLESHINVMFCLDKFHFKQAIHHIALNKTLEVILESYVLHNLKDPFIKVCNYLKQTYPHRLNTIEQKCDYIISNWKEINNLYSYHLSCPMESQISHNIADLFSSRPKGYSINMINKLTELRLLFKNNYNIKELYLNNFNSNTTLIINKEFLDFDIFDKKYNQFNNLYSQFDFNILFNNFY